MALDLSSPEIADVIKEVRNDKSDTGWLVLSYEGKAKVVLKEKGPGGVKEFASALDDDNVFYCLIRVESGDQESKRVKFVFVCYVGPNVGGMAKGRVGGHKGDVMKLVGQSHIDIQTDDMDDLTEDVILTKLKKAAGANYDLGSNAAGYTSNVSGIKDAASSNYKTLEKDTNIGPVQYETFARPKETPVDLAGRPMVAAASAAKANTVMDSEFLGKK